MKRWKKGSMENVPMKNEHGSGGRQMVDVLKGKNVVIYGLSSETDRTIKEWNGKYNIIGLLDSFRTSGEQFGYSILDMNDVAKLPNVIIVAVARPGSCRAIAKKIGGFCRENGIELFDIRGNDLLLERKVVYDFKDARGYQRVEILRRAKRADAVSFDLFDTLVVREVPGSQEVLDILAARLEEQGIAFADLPEKRLEAEKRLSQGHAPSLEQIYADILKKEEGTAIQAGELAQMEYELDLSLLRPRKEMGAVLDEIARLGKDIYITSESYYHKEQIERILDRNGIGHIKEVVVSCEYDEGKRDGLYHRLMNKAHTGNILHIGDDAVADADAEERYGIQSFLIYSPMELLEMAGGLGLLEVAESLSDRIKVGMFAAEIFNSPFQFEDREQKIRIRSAFEIGYLLCAPMLVDFTEWFGKQAEKYQAGNIWFCSRDGYLMQKLFRKFYPDVETEYFLTSRTAAVRAGVMDRADIAYVDSMKFSGTAEENLYMRFGIDARHIPDAKTDEGESGLLKYAGPILKTAEVKRRNNRKYIETLSRREGRTALFDFVAKGTGQMFIRNLVLDEIVGLYFLQLEPEFMEGRHLWIEPFYREGEKEKSAIFENYYILETILTSPDPSVEEFDADGNPVYDIETRKRTDIECVMRAQAGILNYADRYLMICPRDEMKVNKKLDEAFLKLVHGIEILDQDFRELIVEDPFFNRMTAITDVM